MLNDTFFSPLLSSTLAGSHSQVGLKLSENTLKWISYFVFSPNIFLWWILKFFLYDGLDSNLIVFKNFDHSSLIFIFFCIFRKIDDIWKNWNGIPGSITRNFLCVFICWKLLYTLYHEQMLNEKHRQNCNSELINLFWKSMRNRLCWKKIINILVSFQNNEQPYLCKLIQVLLL